MENKTLIPFIIVTCTFALCIGNGIGGYFIGRSIERFKAQDRTVIVKGLSERDVKADFASWSLSFKESENDLTALELKMASHKRLTIDFLQSQGFENSEIKSGVMKVTDKYAREWGHQKKETNRYIAEDTIIVRSANVDLVEETSGGLSTLIKQGVIVSGNPQYFYTKFADLRPEMIAEATKRARESAAQFANDSGSKVGDIKTANQGIFSITGKDISGDKNQDHTETRSLEKKIRIVSTITFGLEK